MRRLYWRGLVSAAALLAGPSALRAGNQNVQIAEVLAGANADSAIQFIELKFCCPTENQWGPQGAETEGRARLVFYDATGLQTGEFVFPGDPPVGLVDSESGGYSALVATQDFADLPGAPAPDFIIPPNVISIDGKVCFKNNPANANADPVDLCLSYGNFVGDTEGAGAPAATAPIVNATSLRRTLNHTTFGTQSNADFAQGPPQPRNSAGTVGSITVADVVDQGFTLFTKETFYGNGRTCATCHRPEADFALPVSLIASLPPNDPLFVAETVPALADLENPCLLRARGLILENIDGFENPHVFRGSPHLLNAALTAPYGLSGEIPDLQSFSTGAVRQHFPKTLARNDDPAAGPLDFRLPTALERIALEAFMQSIALPSDGDFDIDRMVNAAVARGADAAAIQRGRDLFTGAAKCFLCHQGPVLAATDVSLGGGMQNFNTGVVNLPINQSVPCLGGAPLPPEISGFRNFNTPSLIGVVNTAPYFHDNSVNTLRDTVAFYNSDEFNNSIGASRVGGIALNEPQDVDDITAFLEALVEPDVVDCNINGTDDAIDVNTGISLDCNNNKVPDECELAGGDCNANGTPDDCDAGPVVFDPAASLASGDGPFAVVAGDLNGDLMDDVLAVNWLANAVNVFLGGPSGTLTPAGSYSVDSLPHGAAVADFDGDGDLDVAAPSIMNNTVSVLLNRGNDGGGAWLGFDPFQTYPTGGGPLSVVAADLNGDLRPDVASADNVDSTVSILLNLGGTGPGWLGFGPPAGFAVGLGPWYVTAGKLDADADLDLAVANRGANTVSVLWNDGSGGFPTASVMPVGGSPEGVAAEDLDGDGIGDLAVANFDSDTVGILMNDGIGNFAAAVNVGVGSYPFGARPRFVATADFDGDGDLDVLSANNFSNNASILINDGAGVFAQIVNLPVAPQPEAAAIADVNGDGRPDVAVVHFIEDTLSVALNRTPALGGDCNGNGAPDDCDIAAGLAFDFNGSGTPDSCENLGDVDGDADLDFDDLAAFVAVLLGLDTTPAHVAGADVNGDTQADGGDVGPFSTLLIFTAP